jgi:hypothetical protein
MDFFKTVAGKVVGGMVGLVVVIAAISWWRMDDSTRHALLGGTGRIVSWLAIVALLPWATFFVTGWVAKLQTNLSGGLLVAGYTLLEVLVLMWLFSWRIHGTAAWSFVAVGGLLAAVYNILVCDWIAEKMT